MSCNLYDYKARGSRRSDTQILAGTDMCDILGILTSTYYSVQVNKDFASLDPTF